MKKYLKNILLTALLTLLAGCSSGINNLTTSNNNNIDKNIPKIDFYSIKSIADVNAIALEWKGYTADNIAGYNIYRTTLDKNGEELTKIASLKNKYVTHYVDTNLESKTAYLYSMSTIGKNNKHSEISRPVKAETLGTIDSVSFSLAISNLPRQVKILWRPHTNHSVEYYIIQRTERTKNKWATVTRVKNRLSAEFIDTKLKDDYTYYYRIISVTFNNIVSKPSPTITARTKPLPNGTDKMSATKNMAKKIILKWENLDDDNIIGYNIFASTSQNRYFKKIATTKKNDNTFIHNLNKNNARRYYKIASFDKDGLQSDIRTLKSIIGRTIDIPKSPKITLGLIKGNTVIINWKEGDNRANSYIVEKSIKENLFQTKVKVYKNVLNTRFEDSDISKGVEYKFTVQSIDKDGLISKKTAPIYLSIPKKKVK